MRLNQELVKKFQTLHREKYDEEISYDITELQLSELADLVRITTPKQGNQQNDSATTVFHRYPGTQATSSWVPSCKSDRIKR